jgi:hypothetical protein
MNHLDTISLDELIVAAAPQTRADRMFISRAHQTDAVLRQIGCDDARSPDQPAPGIQL